MVIDPPVETAVTFPVWFPYFACRSNLESKSKSWVESDGKRATCPESHVPWGKELTFGRSLHT